VSTHELTIEVCDGEVRVVILCHAAAGEPCRMRGTDPDAESWTAEEATVPANECWAVEYISEGGLECLVYDGATPDPFTYAGPIDVWFDGDGVGWAEAAEATS
jgi:hypothetical protein